MTEGVHQEEAEPRRGVLSVHENDNQHYVVEVCWADGEVSNNIFPIRGFEVVDPVTHQHLGHLTGQESIAILEKNAGTIQRREFSWHNFLPNRK